MNYTRLFNVILLNHQIKVFGHKNTKNVSISTLAFIFETLK